MNALFTAIILVLSASCVQGKREIEDPFNIFCGSEDCYDILNLTRADYSPKEIKKAYRKLALEYHPDKLKYKDVDSDALFVSIAKAAEVLGDREQKELYDYYLDHPRVRRHNNRYIRFHYMSLLIFDVRLYMSFRNTIKLQANIILERFRRLMCV